MLTSHAERLLLCPRLPLDSYLQNSHTLPNAKATQMYIHNYATLHVVIIHHRHLRQGS